MELTIKYLLKDYCKMVFPYSCKAYSNVKLIHLEFEDLMDNQNRNIHVIGSWIIPSPYVLFYDIKDIFNFNLPTLGRNSAATR